MGHNRREIIMNGEWCVMCVYVCGCRCLNVDDKKAHASVWCLVLHTHTIYDPTRNGAIHGERRWTWPLSASRNFTKRIAQCLLRSLRLLMKTRLDGIKNWGIFLPSILTNLNPSRSFIPTEADAKAKSSHTASRTDAPRVTISNWNLISSRKVSDLTYEVLTTTTFVHCATDEV